MQMKIAQIESEVTFFGLPQNPCWISKRTPKKEYPRLNLIFKSVRFEPSIARLMLYFKSPAQYIELCHLSCSHLCHQSRCVNPSHLIFEEIKYNISRNTCKNLGHNLHCDHQPKCFL